MHFSIFGRNLIEEIYPEKTEKKITAPQIPIMVLAASRMASAIQPKPVLFCSEG